MKVTARVISGWDNALSAARFTVGKTTAAGKQPTEAWKRRMCLAEHSPLREVTFRIECFDVPRRAMSHLVRHHEGVEKYVETSRPDRNPNADADVVNVAFTINAQALIQISRVRLCMKAWQETRVCWEEILRAVQRVDNIVTDYCMANCLYRGFCPEAEPCGYAKTVSFKNTHDRFIQLIAQWHTL